MRSTYRPPPVGCGGSCWPLVSVRGGRPFRRGRPGPEPLGHKASGSIVGERADGGCQDRNGRPT